MTSPNAPVDLSPWAPRLAGRRVLLTGSTGYLGSRLLPSFLAAGARITALLRPETSAPPDGIRSLRGDLGAARTWQEALGAEPEIVVHLAAQTSVPAAAADPGADWRANVLPVVRLVEAAREVRSKPSVLLASTATVVGVTPPGPADESAREDPRTVYDLHKLTAERYLRQGVRDGHVTGAALRLANVYGPGAPSSSGDRGILNRVVRRGLEGKPITVYGDGAFRRDYVFVDDVVRAFAALATTPAALEEGRPFLVARGEGIRLVDGFNLVARLAAEATAQEVRVIHVEPPRPLDPIDTRDFVADVRALERATGWRALVGLDEGVRRTIAEWTPTRVRGGAR